MIDPKSVLNAVQASMIADATILSYLELTGETATVKAQGIIKRSQYDDLANSKSRMCIFIRPSRRTGSQIIFEDVLQIDIHVPMQRDMYAYDTLKRVHELLHNKEFGNHIFHWDGMLGDLPTAQNYFCAGTRFICYSTTKNS